MENLKLKHLKLKEKEIEKIYQIEQKKSSTNHLLKKNPRAIESFLKKFEKNRKNFGGEKFGFGRRVRRERREEEENKI